MRNEDLKTVLAWVLEADITVEPKHPVTIAHDEYREFVAYCPECGAFLVVCVKKGKVSVFNDNRSEEELAKKRHARLTGYAAKLNKLGK